MEYRKCGIGYEPGYKRLYQAAPSEAVKSLEGLPALVETLFDDGKRRPRPPKKDPKCPKKRPPRRDPPKRNPRRNPGKNPGRKPRR